MRRIVSLLLVLTLVFALTVPAMAGERGIADGDHGPRAGADDAQRFHGRLFAVKPAPVT